jgi:hypothetical protein
MRFLLRGTLQLPRQDKLIEIEGEGMRSGPAVFARRQKLPGGSSAPALHKKW